MKAGFYIYILDAADRQASPISLSFGVSYPVKSAAPILKEVL